MSAVGWKPKAGLTKITEPKKLTVVIPYSKQDLLSAVMDTTNNLYVKIFLIYSFSYVN